MLGHCKTPRATICIMSAILTVIQNFDVAVNIFIATTIRSETLTPIMLLATDLGRTVPMTLLVLLVSAILLSRKSKCEAYFIVGSALGATMTTMYLKALFMRPRSELALFTEPSFSFPSGHATAAAAVFGSIAMVLYRRANSKTKKLTIAIVALFIIFSISFSRLYLGVHYLSDVLAGWAVGVVWILICYHTLKKYLGRQRLK